MSTDISAKVREISDVLENWRGPIFVAYSGGKDSSAVVKLVANALRIPRRPRKDIKFVYCDTGVENPVVSAFVLRTLKSLAREMEQVGFPKCVKILKPRLDQRFFVRVIGRGYPPPTQFFRWCTKDLRIRPVQFYLRQLGESPLVVLGTRRGESAQRDRGLQDHDGTRGPFIRRQNDGGRNTYVYSPIVEFDLDSVWTTIDELDFPQSIDVTRLAAIYRDGGGECPILRESNDKPCASARFGCWTCTVVRRDKSAEHLIEAGYDSLKPFHEFRRWLSEIRNDPRMRCRRRRNGSEGLGPFTLRARQLILENVRILEATTKKLIIDRKEETEIRRLWQTDRDSVAYRKIDVGVVRAKRTTVKR
jgi:DNA sulfur modification protein DndC